jgi:hypothetical protein
MPPSPYDLRVFSSRTGQWEVRTFVREGDAAGTIADMQYGGLSHSYYGAYWQEVLYVRQHDFVMRYYHCWQPPLKMHVINQGPLIILFFCALQNILIKQYIPSNQAAKMYLLLRDSYNRPFGLSSREVKERGVLRTGRRLLQALCLVPRRIMW